MTGNRGIACELRTTHGLLIHVDRYTADGVEVVASDPNNAGRIQFLQRVTGDEARKLRDWLNREFPEGLAHD